MISFTVQKIFIFAFAALAWEDKLKKYTAKIDVKELTAYVFF